MVKKKNRETLKNPQTNPKPSRVGDIKNLWEAPQLPGVTCVYLSIYIYAYIRYIDVESNPSNISFRSNQDSIWEGILALFVSQLGQMVSWPSALWNDKTICVI